jgi:hypothetical protein
MSSERRQFGEVSGSKVGLPAPPGPSSGEDLSGRGELEHPRCGLVLEGQRQHVYNEEAFRYFLDIERKRSELSSRSFLLLLVDLKKQGTLDVGIDKASAVQLFAALSLCLRETDFVGWYRESRVAGAVLTQHADTGGSDLPDTVLQRITGALGEGLPANVVGRLQVRVYQLPTNTKDPS